MALQLALEMAQALRQVIAEAPQMHQQVFKLLQMKHLHDVVTYLKGTRLEVPIENFADPDNVGQDVARYMAQWQNQAGYLVTYVDGARVDLPLEDFEQVPENLRQDVARYMREWCNQTAADLGMSRRALEALIGDPKRQP